MPSLRVLIVGLLAGLLVGCASIPSSGPVRVGSTADSGPGDPRIRVVAQPPRGGESPAEIVRGFLEAAASSEAGGSPTARRYLAPGTSERWNPDSGVVIYDSGPGFSSHEEDNSTYVLRAHQLAAVDAQGSYSPAQPGDEVRATYRLAKVEGQWRIRDLPDGQLLTEFEFGSKFQQVALYFFDPTYSFLVPDPVFLPIGTALPTDLVGALLRGPTSDFEPSVRSAFPTGTALSVPAVPVDEGVARVDLTDAALKAGKDAREQLSAQLVWTLRQVPEMARLRLTAQGAPYVVPGAGDEQPREFWQRYDPDQLPEGTTAYFRRDGRIFSLGANSSVRPVGGPLGRGTVGFRTAAVSIEGGRAAAVSSDGHRLYLTGTQDGERLRTVLVGTSFTEPSWDRSGNLWVVDRTVHGPVVHRLRAGTFDERVSAPGLVGVAVDVLRVSRDGTRVAVVGNQGRGARLLVGRVERAAATAIVGLESITPGLVSVRDVAWTAADLLTALAREPRGVLQPFVVEVDGSEVTGRGTVPGIGSVASAPDRPLLAGAVAQGRVSIWQWAGGTSWLETARGGDPVYPG